jgi:hypothetical protein
VIPAESPVSLCLDTGTDKATELLRVAVWAVQPCPGEDKPITNHAKSSSRPHRVMEPFTGARRHPWQRR